MLKILEIWTDYLENGYQIDVTYTDLEQVVDRVPHTNVMNKLKWYTIDNNCINLIGSFLTNRLLILKSGKSSK